MTRLTTLRAAALWACVGLLVLSGLPFAVGQTLAPPQPPPDPSIGQPVDELAQADVQAEVTNDFATPPPSDVFLSNCQDHGCGWWLRADALIWWVQGNPVPPLVTASPLGTPIDQAGVPGAHGTKTLFGDDPIDDAARAGARLTLGYWLDGCRDWGMEAHYAYLGTVSGGGFFAESAGDPILARPFFNRGGGVQDAQLVAYPGFLQGQIAVDTLSEIHSAGVLLRHTWLRHCEGELAFVGGYRYFRLRERLAIAERFQVLPGNFPYADWTTTDAWDSFEVQNDFHGGEIGLVSQLDRGPWSVDVSTKLGMGGVLQQLDIAGATQVTVPPDPPLAQSQGLLARSSNIGHYSDTRFAFLPELGVNAGYCLTPSLSLRAGYSLMYLTDVLRAGQQIDTSVGTANGGDPHPQANLDHTSMWVQGINLGLEWRL